jgi:hypothetical protein
MFAHFPKILIVPNGLFLDQKTPRSIVRTLPNCVYDLTQEFSKTRTNQNTQGDQMREIITVSVACLTRSIAGDKQ